jgi:putative SOS response-associated peptidase YedK
LSEGMSGTEVGKEIAEHAKHSRSHHAPERRDRVVPIVEAVLLSLVTMAAARSGYAAAKWNGESSERLTSALEARTDASPADLDAREDRNYDLSTFEACSTPPLQSTSMRWSLPCVASVPSSRSRSTPGAPLTRTRTPTAPRGPTLMPQYRQPQLADGTRSPPSVAARRLIVPVEGFYEWMPTTRVGKAGKPLKQPYFLRPRDGDVLPLAGLYERWRDPAKPTDDPGGWLTTFTIITTTATDGVGHVHDRMPMTIAPEHWAGTRGLTPHGRTRRPSRR